MNGLLKHIISYKVALNLDVLSPFMEDIIMGKFNGTIVITKEGCRLSRRDAHIAKKPMQVDELCSGMHKGMIFSLNSGA